MKEKKKEVTKKPSTSNSAGDINTTNLKRKGTSRVDTPGSDLELKVDTEVKPEPRILRLESKMSSLVSSPGSDDPERQDEEVTKRDEVEIKGHYQVAEGDGQGRAIEHLVLITHGIGQLLGLRMENVRRKTLKGVYETLPDLQALKSQVDKLLNFRIQVLPVIWRHLLDFPKRGFQDKRREQDLNRCRWRK